MDKSQINEKITEISKTIFSYCMAKTNTREDAEDLSQEILCELIKSSQSLRREDAFYRFMWSVANNVYKQWYRKKKRDSTSPLPWEEEDAANNADIADVDAEFEDSLADKEEQENLIFLLRRELALLSENHRRAAILYYIENRSCPQIAHTLSISESMVKYLLFRSRKILKEGMNMERKLGTLSYNPKSLTPMYSGEGPNHFWDFMQTKIRQNIVGACYNDSLTPQQISIETGIPLPYLEDDINALTEKNILLCEGGRYKVNIIIISEDCYAEINRSAEKHHEKIAEVINEFITSHLSEFRSIGFAGADFSDNTLRWQLSTLIFRCILFSGIGNTKFEAPKTAWGERAFTYCIEYEPTSLGINEGFGYCGVSSNKNDSIFFFDYRPKLHGEHHDFYGKEHKINIFCDIARGETDRFSEYDLEVVEELVSLGYVINENGRYRTATPIYTKEQYEKAYGMVFAFVQDELFEYIRDMDASAASVLSNHTPKHLQDQVAAIAPLSKLENAVVAPAYIMIEKGYLSTEWNPIELPGTYVVLDK